MITVSDKIGEGKFLPEFSNIPREVIGLSGVVLDGILTNIDPCPAQGFILVRGFILDVRDRHEFE